MRLRTSVVVAVVVSLLWVAGSVAAEKTNKVLAGVKTVQVEDTVVPNPSKVKEDHAANQVTDSLKRALRDADFEVGEAPIRAHLVLDEFTSGSMAKRFVVGFGAGRSTVDCRLVLTDAAGKELFSKRIRVRGNLVFSPYQGDNTQRRQAVNSFEQKLIEEIEGLK